MTDEKTYTVAIDGLAEEAEKAYSRGETMPLSPSVKPFSIDGVYRERNRLVAFLSRLFPSTISYDQDPAWPVVFIATPQGQLSWHVTAQEAVDLFAHVERNDETEWDGHTTEEKYRRLARLGKGDVRKKVS